MQELIGNLKDAARYLLQNGQTRQGLAVQACVTMLEDDSDDQPAHDKRFPTGASEDGCRAPLQGACKWPECSNAEGFCTAEVRTPLYTRPIAADTQGEAEDTALVDGNGELRQWVRDANAVGVKSAAVLIETPHGRVCLNETPGALPGLATLENVIQQLRMEGFYRDDEGEATGRLEDLLTALTSGVPAMDGSQPDA